jgi:hypothetical protein
MKRGQQVSLTWRNGNLNTGGPAVLAVQKPDVLGIVPGHLLDVFNGLRDIVEIDLGGILERCTLPVRERVAETAVRFSQ